MAKKRSEAKAKVEGQAEEAGCDRTRCDFDRIANFNPKAPRHDDIKRLKLCPHHEAVVEREIARFGR